MAENPFLLPSRGSGPPDAPVAPKPTLVPQVAPPARDPDRYIALPPSIESATHRIARPETAPTDVPLTDVRPVAPPTAKTSPTVPPVAEETELAAPPAHRAPMLWSLVLPDGSRVVVDGPIVLGRDPSVPPTAPTAKPVPLVDPGKTVSKTHALLVPAAPGEGGMRVTDLHSTNGVAVTFGGIRTVLAPGGDGIAEAGAVIELGSLTLLLDAR